MPANHVSLDFSISETGLDPGEKFEELEVEKILKRSFEFTIEFIIRAGSSGKEKFGRKMVLRDSEGYYWRDRFIAGHAISVTNDSARDNTERFCFVFEHFFSLPQRLAESGIFFFFLLNAARFACARLSSSLVPGDSDWAVGNDGGGGWREGKKKSSGEYGDTVVNPARFRNNNGHTFQE